MGELFGTDGVRGMANAYPLDVETGIRIGRAIARYFRQNGKSNDAPVLIGKDTRISGDMIEASLISGICAEGVNVLAAGILPTPGISYLTGVMKALPGVVISASHNPYHDNGIKLFNPDGFKFSDTVESEIESLILNNEVQASPLERTREVGRVVNLGTPKDQYIRFLKGSIKNITDFKGLKIVLDCANGAAFEVAPELFSSLGTRLDVIFADPNGKNINDQCGSQYPETLCKKVVERSADMGIALDGDADRLIAVDEKGDVLTGDQILAICAAHLKELGCLKNNMVVSTIMSNIGLGQALEKLDIGHLETNVGDRYVMQEMIRSGSVLGGEDSGHMIFLDFHTTGDGILSALQLIQAMISQKKQLSELKKIMRVYPQILMNVAVNQKPDLYTIREIRDTIQSVEARLQSNGRVLVRYSGTQPLCRVMVEGPSEEETKAYCIEITESIQKNIGNA